MSQTGTELLRAAKNRMEAAGIGDGHRDATRLFLHAVHQVTGAPHKRHHLSQYLNIAVPAEVVTVFQQAIDARVKRQPVSQIIGRRAFWKHEFTVTNATLDPRPETEVLVGSALQLPWQSVLDLGTGTGAILISLLAERPASVGTGTDISEPALDVARQNAHLIGVAGRFIRADWFDGLSGQYDLIVSNPPYIAKSEMHELAPEVRDWEPHLALTDNADGLSAYRVIAASAAQYLTPSGHILVEIGALQGAAVTAIFRANGAITRLIPDLDGRDRVVLARFGAILTNLSIK